MPLLPTKGRNYHENVVESILSFDICVTCFFESVQKCRPAFLRHGKPLTILGRDVYFEKTHTTHSEIVKALVLGPCGAAFAAAAAAAGAGAVWN